MTKLSEILNLAQLESIRQARGQRLSYGLCALSSPEGRAVVVLGETHLKFSAAWRTGQLVVDAFAERGVETPRLDSLPLRLFLRVTIEGPRVLVRLLSLGCLRGSTITCARAAPHGHTTLLEQDIAVPGPLLVGFGYLGLLFGVLLTLLLVSVGAAIESPAQAVLTSASRVLLPVAALAELHLVVTIFPAIALRRRRFAWLLNPAIAILTHRDVIMAAGTVAMLGARPGDQPVLTIMGRAHLPGYSQELVEHHGFTLLEVD